MGDESDEDANPLGDTSDFQSAMDWESAILKAAFGHDRTAAIHLLTSSKDQQDDSVKRVVGESFSDDAGVALAVLKSCFIVDEAWLVGILSRFPEDYDLQMEGLKALRDVPTSYILLLGVEAVVRAWTYALPIDIDGVSGGDASSDSDSESDMDGDSDSSSSDSDRGRRRGSGRVRGRGSLSRKKAAEALLVTGLKLLSLNRRGLVVPIWEQRPTHFFRVSPYQLNFILDRLRRLALRNPDMVRNILDFVSNVDVLGNPDLRAALLEHVATVRACLDVRDKSETVQWTILATIPASVVGTKLGFLPCVKSLMASIEATISVPAPIDMEPTKCRSSLVQLKAMLCLATNKSTGGAVSDVKECLRHVRSKSPLVHALASCSSALPFSTFVAGKGRTICKCKSKFPDVSSLFFSIHQLACDVIHCVTVSKYPIK